MVRRACDELGKRAGSLLRQGVDGLKAVRKPPRLEVLTLTHRLGRELRGDQLFLGGGGEGVHRGVQGERRQQQRGEPRAEPGGLRRAAQRAGARDQECRRTGRGRRGDDGQERGDRCRGLAEGEYRRNESGAARDDRQRAKRGRPRHAPEKRRHSQDNGRAPDDPGMQQEQTEGHAKARRVHRMEGEVQQVERRARGDGFQDPFVLPQDAGSKRARPDVGERQACRPGGVQQRQATPRCGDALTLQRVERKPHHRRHEEGVGDQFECKRRRRRLQDRCGGRKHQASRQQASQHTRRGQEEDRAAGRVPPQFQDEARGQEQRPNQDGQEPGAREGVESLTGLGEPCWRHLGFGQHLSIRRAHRERMRRLSLGLAVMRPYDDINDRSR